MMATSVLSGSDNRRDVVLRWLKRNERGIAWLARKTGYTPSYLSRVLHGKDAFTDNVAKRFEEVLEIDFANELSLPEGAWVTD